MKLIKIISGGIITGLVLQLALGPIFFLVVYIAMQGMTTNALTAALAVACVDIFYISLAVLGIARFIKNERVQRIFSLLGPVVIVVFGIIILLHAGHDTSVHSVGNFMSMNPLQSFLTVMIATLINPLTIIFYLGLFTTKISERNYSKKEIWIFGLSVGFATLMFMTVSVLLVSIIKDILSAEITNILNLLVGIVLVVYGARRLILKEKN